MNNKLGLKKMREVINSFSINDPEKNFNLYSNLISIIYRFDNIAKMEETPNYQVYKSELLNHIEALCHLDEDNGHSFEQHLSWAIATMNKLESVHCFNVR